MLSFSTNFATALTIVTCLFPICATFAYSNQYVSYPQNRLSNFSGSESSFAVKTRTPVKDTVASSSYVRASTPIQIFECTQKLSLLRCLKLFLLQRMSNLKIIPKSGDLKKDFLQQVLYQDKHYPSLLDKKYATITDDQLSEMLLECFQKFFKDRDIKLHFIPGMMVRVVPNNENRIRLSLKQGNSSGRKQKPYKQMIQLAVPMMMMPAVLLGTILPFVLPAVKMATIMSSLMNSGALIAAIMYAAKTASGNTEEHLVHYSHPGYH